LGVNGQAIICVLELVLLVYSFRYEDARRYRETLQRSARTVVGGNKEGIITQGVVWICAAYLLLYVGTESAISDWVVSFMTRARHASALLSSMCSSGFWIGMAVGRVALGFSTDRLGVRRANTIYLVACMVTQLLFAVVEAPAVSVALMALLGFFCGPLFPSSIVLMCSMLREELHVGAVSLVASVGQVGGSLLPFAIGVMAEKLGIRVFQFVIVAQLAATLVVWVVFIRCQ
jgi:fucose permease